MTRTRLTSVLPEADSSDMACSSAYIFLALWRSLLSETRLVRLMLSSTSTLAIEGRPSLSTLDTRWESFFTLSRLLMTSSVASSDSHSVLVAASPAPRLGWLVGLVATSDQEPSSADTEMVGFLGGEIYQTGLEYIVTISNSIPSSSNYPSLTTIYKLSRPYISLQVFLLGLAGRFSSDKQTGGEETF